MAWAEPPRCLYFGASRSRCTSCTTPEGDAVSSGTPRGILDEHNERRESVVGYHSDGWQREAGLLLVNLVQPAMADEQRCGNGWMAVRGTAASRCGATRLETGPWALCATCRVAAARHVHPAGGSDHVSAADHRLSEPRPRRGRRGAPCGTLMYGRASWNTKTDVNIYVYIRIYIYTYIY